MRVHVLTIAADGQVERSDYIDMPGSDLTKEACKAHALSQEDVDGSEIEHVHIVRGTAGSIVVEVPQDEPWTWRKVIYTVA